MNGSPSILAIPPLLQGGEQQTSVDPDAGVNPAPNASRSSAKTRQHGRRYSFVPLPCHHFCCSLVIYHKPFLCAGAVPFAAKPHFTLYPPALTLLLQRSKSCRHPPYFQALTGAAGDVEDNARCTQAIAHARLLIRMSVPFFNLDGLSRLRELAYCPHARGILSNLRLADVPVPPQL